MNIIQNIKHQYQLKLFQDHLLNSKFSEARSVLQDYIKKNIPNSLNLLKTAMPEILKITANEKILNDNIILINSFDANDNKILTNFINFYLTNLNIKHYEISDYQMKLIEIFKQINSNQKIITADNNFQNSMYYQTIMTCLQPGLTQFMSNQFAFFSTPSNINFTNMRTTKCFFLIVEHPYTAYERLKLHFASKDLAISSILNLDDRPLIFKNNGFELEITRKDWGVFNSSWSDPNVLNSLKGMVLKKEDLFINPEEFFANVILHLRQCQYAVPLDYKVISNYITSLNLPKKIDDFDTPSNKEKKLLKKIANTADKLNYHL